MLKRLIFILTLFVSFFVSAQQSTTFSGQDGFINDGSGNLSSTTTGWNQNMLTSENFIAANTDGSVSYTIVNTNDKMAFGLAIASTSLKTKDITYRILGNKKVAVWENNKHKGNYGNLAVGDVLEIAREGDQIVFRKNGNTLLSLTTDPSLTLFVKVQTQTGGMIIPADAVTGDYYEDMELSFIATHETCLENGIGEIDLTVIKGLAPYTYSWSNTSSNEDLSALSSGTYTVTVTDAINKQESISIVIQKGVVWQNPVGDHSISKNQLLADADGNVSYHINQAGLTKTIGLSELGITQADNVMDYTVQLHSDGSINLFEQGTQLTGDFGEYNLGDLITIERFGTEIKYSINNIVIHTTSTDASKILVAKFYLNQTGASFDNVNTSFCNISLEVDYTTTLVSQYLLGGIHLLPNYGTPPYTYLWEDGTTDQVKTNLESGIYNVTVSDAGGTSIPLKIVVGMELEFADITGLDVINNEELLKTETDGFGNGITTLNNLVDGNGEVRIEVVELNKEFTFGYREEQNPQATDYTDLSYGLYVDASNNLSSYDNETLTNIGTIDIGDILCIEKIDANIYYKKNDQILSQAFISIPSDTIILPNDTSVNDTNTHRLGIVVGINETTSTTTIMSLEDGTQCTCSETLSTDVVVGSTVSYNADQTTNTATNIQFPVGVGSDDPRLCDRPKDNLPLFRIDFSLYNTQLRISSIKVIKFSVIPKITANINHAICNTPNSGAIGLTMKGGVPPFTYSWTGPNGFSANTSEIIGIEPGIYNVAVTDSWLNPHVVNGSYEVGYTVDFGNIVGSRETNPRDNNPGTIDSNCPGLSRSELCVAATNEGTAKSLNQIYPFEDGSYSYIIDQVGYTKTFGLGEDDNTKAAESTPSNYAMRLLNDGSILLFEATGPVGNFGTYQLGDLISIGREGNNIIYSKNGTVLRTSPTDDSKTLIAKFKLDETCASFNNPYVNFCNIPFFTIDTRDILDIDSYDITGARLNETVTTGTEKEFYPYVPSGQTEIVEIVIYNQNDNTTARIAIKLDDELEVVASSMRIEDVEGNILKKYGTSNYIKKGGSSSKFSFSLAQLYAELIFLCVDDDDLNWTSSKFFDEDGNLVSSGKSYFNYLGNPIQSQSKNFSDNIVIASQPVYDAYGRSVLTTLPAPTYEQTFCYKPDFIQAHGNLDYDYTQFDVPNYTTSPNVIVSGEVDNPRVVEKSDKGSLGWFYSDNNIEEPMVASTFYPYTRIEFDPNNPGKIKRSSAPHDLLKMGSSHEARAFSMPASGELNYVFGYANGWVVGDDFGPIPGDPNGDWQINNTDLKTEYQVIKNIVKDEDGNEAVIFTDNKGNEIAKCISGTGDDGTNQNEYHVFSLIGGSNWNERYVDIHLPEGCETTLELENDASNSITYQILDLDKNKYVDFSGNINFNGTQPSLPPGYYRIIHTSGGSINNILTLSYDLNYYDFTLYYYDRVDRLVAIVPPNGIDETYNPNLSISTATASSDFVESGGNFGLGSVNVYTHSKPVTPTSVGDKEFSDIIFYIDDGSSFGGTFMDPQANLSTARLAPGTVSYGSSIITSDLEYVPGPGGDPCPCPVQPGLYCTDQTNSQLAEAWLNCGPSPTIVGPTGVASGAFDDNGNPKYWYCVSCDVANAQFYRSYSITVDVYADDDPNTKLADDRIFNATYYANQWYFNSSTPSNLLNVILLNIPSANSCVMGVERSALANNLIFEIVDLKEYSYQLDQQSQTYHLVETFIYDKLPDLKLNARINKHTFTGGSPDHSMLSTSQYNSVGQLLKSHSPDEGDADIVYSEEGLLRFSRNNKQKAVDAFSYTNYDELGRPIESGVYDASILAPGFDNLFFQNHYNEYSLPQGLISTTDPLVLNDLDYDISASGKTSERTYTEYDFADPNFNSTTLLPPIDYAQHVNLGDVSKTWNDNTTTWYSYDYQGRLIWMVQQIFGLGTTTADEVKTIDYVYNSKGDLEEVIYQKNHLTEYFAHRYTYDIDKRLSNVETRESATGTWNQQAKYQYYQHGPVKRVELADELQGIDYIYTTLGWLKAINSPNLGENSGSQFIDPGQDGITNNVAPDAFGMTLDYFSGDYSRTNTYVNSGISQNQNYNGNIKSVRWNTQDLATSGLDQWMYEYQYNKKGWITTATFGEYAHGPSDFEVFNPNASDEYLLANVTHDANGNILTLDRNGSSSSISMDRFNYYYKPNTNQLDYINDAGTNYPLQDIKGGQTTGNYSYDEIGQLIGDASNPDSKFYDYDVRGMVTAIYNDAAKTDPIITINYDDKGYRVKKTAYTSGTPTVNTWYVRDASGNIASIYNEDIGNNTTNEYPLYASNRIGTYYNGGDYVYELSDYLGNVRATIRDLGAQAVIVGTNDFDTGLDGWTSPIPQPGVILSNPNQDLNILMDNTNISSNGNTAVSSPFTNVNEGIANYLDFSYVLTGGSFTAEVWNNGNLVNSQNIVAGTGQAKLSFYMPGNSTTTVDVIFRSFDNIDLTIDNLIISKVDHPIDVLSYADYYPFGEQLPDRKFQSSLLYKYTYQGQELDEETGLEAFELRMWDGRSGRWMSTDPERQYSSTYLGMGNNPVNGIDPNGGWVWGAGLWRNLFYSDNRINAEDYAHFNGGTAYKENGVWWVEGQIGGGEFGVWAKEFGKGGINISTFKNVPIVEIPGSWGGITLPPFAIFVDDASNSAWGQDLLHHEYGHWLQYQEVGVQDFYTLYGIPSLKNTIDEWYNDNINPIPVVDHHYYFTERNANIRTVLRTGHDFKYNFPTKITKENHNKIHVKGSNSILKYFK